jgi:organic radical activating enzyme
MQRVGTGKQEKKMLRVSQIFGPTLQGEGSAAGQHCLFLRLFDCNLQCTWCDTAYTWAYTDQRAAKTQSGHKYEKLDPAYGLKEMSTEEVFGALEKLWPIYTHPTIVVVSGGEPMMQQGGLEPVLTELIHHGNKVHVETAGTIAPVQLEGCVTQFNCSPKLESSGNRKSIRYKPEVLRELTSYNTWFKFVVTQDTREADLTEVDDIVKEVGIDPRRVQLMPEGSTTEQNVTTARLIVDDVLARGYGLTMREHVLLWGDDPDK